MVSKMNYEKNVKELENIVEKMSSEKLSMEEGLALYEKGIALATESLKELNEVKGKIEILNKRLEDLEAAEDIDVDTDDDDDD